MDVLLPANYTQSQATAESEMVTYIATVWAKPGHDNEVARFYQELESVLREAPGFRDRRILRARPGTMAGALRKSMPAGPPAGGHAEPPGPVGTHFVMVEHWDSVDQRIAFSRGAGSGRSKQLLAHILPEHSHEFYEDITPA
jgi:hypothetical protein